MTKYIRGVNLGGWLVVEKWMTPALFKGTPAIDEYTLMEDPECKKRIEKHRRTFIEEHDFAWLRDHNIDLVRIPVGYWLLDAADGYAPTVEYLDRAMEWAAKYDIRVLIDLHGAPGSQNGKDHSGRIGRSLWFDDKPCRVLTLHLLERIAERYKDSPALWGIEILNEPAHGIRHYFMLLGFYREAYNRLTRILRPGTHIVYHDAFHPLLYAGAITAKKTHPVMMDTHWYGFASKAPDFESFLYDATRLRKWLLRLVQLRQPVLIGEWSSVLPQKFFDKAAHDKHDDMLRRNAAAQQAVYKKAAGWIYWNYRVEAGGMWSFRDMVNRGIIK